MRCFLDLLPRALPVSRDCGHSAKAAAILHVVGGFRQGDRDTDTDTDTSSRLEITCYLLDWPCSSSISLFLALIVASQGLRQAFPSAENVTDDACGQLHWTPYSRLCLQLALICLQSSSSELQLFSCCCFHSSVMASGNTMGTRELGIPAVCALVHSVTASLFL